MLVHLFYFAALIESYRAGDMGQVYPIARGSAPLMTATATAVLLGERIGWLGWCGIVLLAAGVLLISLRGGRDLARLDRRAVGFALFTAVTVCAYSVVDGVGARLSGNANAYSLALFVGIGPVMAVYALARSGPAVFAAMRRALVHRACRRRAAARFLCGRDLGDDGRADRAGGGAARNQRAVRRRHRGGAAEGAAAREPHRRGALDRHWACADPVGVTRSRSSSGRLDLLEPWQSATSSMASTGGKPPTERNTSRCTKIA